MKYILGKYILFQQMLQFYASSVFTKYGKNSLIFGLWIYLIAQTESIVKPHILVYNTSLYMA